MSLSKEVSILSLIKIKVEKTKVPRLPDVIYSGGPTIIYSSGYVELGTELVVYKKFIRFTLIKDYIENILFVNKSGESIRVPGYAIITNIT
jgi:hypothetical protein